MEVISSSTGSSAEECKCAQFPKTISRESKPGCAEDNDAVAVLPDDWVPRRSGPILANYLKQREQDHNDIHEDILKCAAKANGDIDIEIRTLSENFLTHINQNQVEIDCVVEKCQINDRVLTTDGRIDALKRINEISLQRLDDMATFNREASDLEKKRADKLRIILRNKFQRLLAVGHMTPKELLHDFDERIYEINQQLLSNSRAFKELEAQLRVQLDENVVHAKSCLNQLSLGVVVVYRRRNSHSALRHSIDETISQRPLNALRMREPSIEKSFLGDVEELDACVSRLVEAYRSAVLKVFTGFYTKLDMLQRNLYSHHDLFDPYCKDHIDLTDFESLIKRPLQRLATFHENVSKSKTLLLLTGADIVSMQKSLWSLGECLHNTYSILHCAGHLWDAHLLRSALAQKLTIAAVEDLLTSHDTTELMIEVPFSIALEQLRCSPDSEKINQQFDSISSMLTRTAEMYQRHSEAELGRLEEFMNLPDAMANTLLAEFDLFLEKNPRSVPSTEAVGAQTPQRNPSFLRLPLPRVLLLTELQELALKNWRNGFLESFEGNISLVPEELRHQAQLWVEDRSTSLHMRYSMKMVAHSIRTERVKAAREARLAELLLHETRLESHLAAVYHLVEYLPGQASEFGAIDAPFLYPLTVWVDRIQAGIDEVLTLTPPNPETRKLKMSSYALRLPIHRRFYEESLDKAVEEYKSYIEHRVQEARISNVRFLSHIKLFSEGGRYATQEAIKTCSALTKASDALEVCLQKSLDTLHNRRSQLLANADQYILPLVRQLEVQGKTSAKSNAKPEKKPTKKKK